MTGDHTSAALREELLSKLNQIDPKLASKCSTICTDYAANIRGAVKGLGQITDIGCQVLSLFMGLCRIECILLCTAIIGLFVLIG